MSIQQVKENLEKINQRNQSLIDLANATTGKEDTTLTDGVNSLIDNYGKGGTDTTDATATASDVLKDKTAYVVGKKITGTIETFDGSYECSGDSTGGGSLEGLENGYDVMFYDENNDGLALFSIKQGHSINAPVYNTDWIAEDGTVIIFPYTPTSDVVLYAKQKLYSDELYEYFGVDKALYPNVVIMESDYSSTKTYKTVLFANTLSVSGNQINFSNGAMAQSVTNNILDTSSETYFEELYNEILNFDVNLTSKTNSSYYNCIRGYSNDNALTSDYVFNMDK